MAELTKQCNMVGGIFQNDLYNASTTHAETC